MHVTFNNETHTFAIEGMSAEQMAGVMDAVWTSYHGGYAVYINKTNADELYHQIRESFLNIMQIDNKAYNKNMKEKVSK